MPAPSQIRKVAQQPNGNFKILGVFPKPFADQVEVVNANPADIAPLRGASWMSKNFYATLAQGLKVYEQDGTTPTFAYDANGKIVSGCFAEFIDEPSALNNSPSVIVTWAIVLDPAPINLHHFRVERCMTETGAFTVPSNGDNIPPSQFIYQDNNPLKDINDAIIGFYRVVAVCGSGAIAATSAVVPVM